MAKKAGKSVSKGKHMMPNGHMMSDKEMDKMMKEKKMPPKKMPPKKMPPKKMPMKKKR